MRGESGLGELGPDGAPLADPALAGAPGQGDPMSQAAPMAAMLPSMLAGVLGGALGAVARCPPRSDSRSSQWPRRQVKPWRG